VKPHDHDCECLSCLSERQQEQWDRDYDRFRDEAAVRQWEQSLESEKAK